MHDMSAEPAVHHLAPPQGFIRKHVFSLDHKVIGLAVLRPGACRRFYRHGSFLANAAPLGLGFSSRFRAGYTSRPTARRVA